MKQERAKRAFWVNHQDNGMSFIGAYVPTPHAVFIDATYTERAKVISDDRTLDQRRADLFIEQLRGTTDGALTSSRAVIGITVPVISLVGLDDQPGESFDGTYALPAQMVREMTAEPGTLWFRILTDPLGRILDTTEPRPHGPTNGDNLRALCRRHHNIKTHQIAEPTRFTMRDHTRSPLELDVMHLATHFAYAACGLRCPS